MSPGKSGTNFIKMAGRRSITITDKVFPLRKYSKNNLFITNYFTFVNSSVTLINNCTISMSNSNVTTESGGRQNMFPTETRPYIDESVSYDSYPQNAEKVNGRWAMIGLVALVGAYVSTGQIIPGIF